MPKYLTNGYGAIWEKCAVQLTRESDSSVSLELAKQQLGESRQGHVTHGIVGHSSPQAFPPLPPPEKAKLVLFLEGVGGGRTPSPPPV